MSMMCRPKWPFLLMCVFHDVRHVDFRGLTGSQRTPRVWGVTFILKFSVYSEVVDRALIIEKDAEELHQYREQQRKRGKSDNAHGSHVEKKLASSSSLQLEIIAEGRQRKIQISFVLLVAKGMGTWHVIRRHELALVVRS